MAETYHAYHIYEPGDMKVTLADWKNTPGKYYLSIGTANYVEFIGDLESLAQIFAMGEALVEHERARKAMPVGFEEEKKRAEGT